MSENLNKNGNTNEEIIENTIAHKFMDWSSLISDNTLQERDFPEGYEFLANYPIDSYEMDYENIVSSSAFRRLQDKAQLFPLDQSDFVRTRLTHSMEVSAIARHLGIMATTLKAKTEKDPPDYPGDYTLSNEPEEIKNAIPTILSCAGLIHDLGNPPFGHFGEDAIRDWFKDDKELMPYRDREIKVTIKDVLTEEQYADLCNFEGNAQAIRILSKIKYASEDNNLNVTYALINTLIKYTVDSKHIDKDNSDVKKHKLGYFQAEKDILNEICTTTTTKRDDGSYCRHPLTYLLEAADDIAYTTSDLEDTVKKGLLNINQFMDYYYRTIYKYITEIEDNEQHIKPEYEDEYKKMSKSTTMCDFFREHTYSEEVFFERYGDDRDFILFHKWIELVRQCMMYSVAYSFNLNYAEIMAGTYKYDLFESGYNKYTIKVLKKAAHEYAHKSTGILKVELSAKKIIYSLLDDFIPAVIDWPNEIPNKGLPTKEHEKLQEILPANLKADYNMFIEGHSDLDENEKLYRRLLMVTDFISGMTDSYARNLYQELNGM